MYKKMSLLLVGLLLLPGCYRVPQYRNQSLRFVDDNSGYRESQQGLVLRAKRLTNCDKKELFGQYSKKLSKPSNGPIEVIYLSFHNLSTATYILPSTGIDLEMVPHCDIAQLMKTSTAGRIAGFFGSYFGMGIGAFVGWAGLWMMSANNAPGWAPLIPIAGAGGAIAGAVYSTKYESSIGQSMKTNERIAQDLEDKALEEGIVIQSGDKYEGLVFVKSQNYTPLFNVIIREQNSRAKKIIFDVDLQASFKAYEQVSQ